MFIDQIAAGVAFIYNALVKLVALSTPVLAVLSLPIGSSIMDSVYAMVEQKDSERIAFELKKIGKRLTLLLLPFAFGVFAIARLIFTRTPNILPVSIKYLEKFELGGIIVICFLPGAIGAFQILNGRKIWGCAAGRKLARLSLAPTLLIVGSSFPCLSSVGNG